VCIVCDTLTGVVLRLFGVIQCCNLLEASEQNVFIFVTQLDSKVKNKYPMHWKNNY
jgi:hypothetical protein